MCEYVGTEIPDMWEKFGIFVKVKRGDLRAIKAGRPKEKNGFIQVFDKWHNGMTSPYTWEKVAEALESSDVDEKWLLTKLYMKLAKAGTFRNLIANWCYIVNIRVYFFSLSYFIRSIIMKAYNHTSIIKVAMQLMSGK